MKTTSKLTAAVLIALGVFTGSGLLSACNADPKPTKNPVGISNIGDSVIAVPSQAHRSSGEERHCLRYGPPGKQHYRRKVCR